jgi:Ran GTPase-activating protein (RanGAP) involved in mRNA processing and transport
MYEPENKGLINWFHTLLYQIEAQEFLDIIGNAVSEDSSKVAKAKSKFEEIMREAVKLKDEFEEYQEEEGIDSDEDEDDGLDDFLGSLGISRPN